MSITHSIRTLNKSPRKGTPHNKNSSQGSSEPLDQEKPHSKAIPDRQEHQKHRPVQGIAVNIPLSPAPPQSQSRNPKSTNLSFFSLHSPSRKLRSVLGPSQLFTIVISHVLVAILPISHPSTQTRFFAIRGMISLLSLMMATVSRISVSAGSSCLCDSLRHVSAGKVLDRTPPLPGITIAPSTPRETI